MEDSMNILVVDDEPMIREAVASYLEKQGYHVFLAETGKAAFEVFEREKIAFIVLDLMLPDISGEELCAEIRRRSRVPIIMLTARTMEEDMLNGLKIGADDYITKPFSLKNLYARIQAVLRRTVTEDQPAAQRFTFRDGELVIDCENKKLYKDGRAVAVTPLEWKILTAFVRYPQKVFTREELIAAAFDDAFDGYDRVIDTHIKNLRKKIETDPKKPVYIRTVHGIGYGFGGNEP